VTTSVDARRKFAVIGPFSPGILLIRHLALRAIKATTERRALQ